MDYREIQLTQGQFSKVSPEDFEWLNQWKWSARWSKFTKSFYAMRNSSSIGGTKRHIILMHRQILGLEKGDRRHGDHANCDTLDNRRENLRIATRSQNFPNTKLRSTNTSGFKNVYWNKKLQKYTAAYHREGRLIHVGVFPTAESAFEAVSSVIAEVRGEFARMDRC